MANHGDSRQVAPAARGRPGPGGETSPGATDPKARSRDLQRGLRWTNSATNSVTKCSNSSSRFDFVDGFMMIYDDSWIVSGQFGCLIFAEVRRRCWGGPIFCSFQLFLLTAQTGQTPSNHVRWICVKLLPGRRSRNSMEFISMVHGHPVIPPWFGWGLCLQKLYNIHLSPSAQWPDEYQAAGSTRKMHNWASVDLLPHDVT